MHATFIEAMPNNNDKFRRLIRIALIVYMFALAWFKDALFLSVSYFGFIPTTIVVLILPTMGKFISMVCLKKQTENKPRLRQLSEQQYHLLTKSAPTAQLALINHVLLISLSLIYDLLNSIALPNQDDKSLFAEKLKALVRLFKTITQRPEFVNSTLTSRSKNNAITAFAFYRLLFKDVVEKATEQQIFDARDHDPWILLKRIPPKLSLYLGSQAWRLYELKQIISGDLSSLVLNADIGPALIALCNEDRMTHSAIQAVSPRPETIPQEAINHPENIQSTLIEEPKSFQSPLNNTEAIEETATELQVKLDKWLQRQLRRYGVNETERFYVSIIDFGKTKVFASDTGLCDFAKKSNIDLSTLKKVLIKNGIADAKTYYLERSGHPKQALMGIHIEFDVPVVQPLQGTIVR